MESINICYLINGKSLQLTLDSMNYIKRFFRAANYNLKFYIIGIDEFNVPEDVTFIKSTHIELPLLWQRMYISEMLNIDKVIFLDSDTVTSTCISKLYNIDLEGNTIGAVQHQISPIMNDWIAGYNLRFAPFTDIPSAPFFNCGVMVIDCKKWLERNITDKCLEVFKTYEHTRHIKRDEPAFNVALFNDWLQLDERWNYLPRGSYKKAFITHYYGQYFGSKPRHNMF